tara:strand:- start:239 stop:463 length:225 start_codon:yes stop_codon:yes gene_type:complete
MAIDGCLSCLVANQRIAALIEWAVKEEKAVVRPIGTVDLFCSIIEEAVSEISSGVPGLQLRRFSDDREIFVKTE